MLVALAWSAAVAYADLRYRRIPNGLTLGAAGVGIGCWAIAGAGPFGCSGVSIAMGSGLALLLTLPGFVARQLGGADVKLLVAIALLGGVAAVIVAFAVGTLASAALAVAWVRVGPRIGLPRPAGRWLPFGASLALGFALAVLLGQAGEVRWPA